MMTNNSIDKIKEPVYNLADHISDNVNISLRHIILGCFTNKKINDSWLKSRQQFVREKL